MTDAARRLTTALEGRYTIERELGADGRFIMARRVHMDVGQASPLIVVENWFTEFNQRLGKK